METAQIAFDYVTNHLPEIVSYGLMASGAVAQLAAILKLDWLANVSTTLRDVVQFVAGNWGRAANVEQVLVTYRTVGSAAAMQLVEKLAKD